MKFESNTIKKSTGRSIGKSADKWPKRYAVELGYRSGYRLSIKPIFRPLNCSSTSTQGEWQMRMVWTHGVPATDFENEPIENEFIYCRSPINNNLVQIAPRTLRKYNLTLADKFRDWYRFEDGSWQHISTASGLYLPTQYKYLIKKRTVGRQSSLFFISKVGLRTHSPSFKEAEKRHCTVICSLTERGGQFNLVPCMEAEEFYRLARPDDQRHKQWFYVKKTDLKMHEMIELQGKNNDPASRTTNSNS